MKVYANNTWPAAWPAELRLLVVYLRMALGTATAIDHHLASQPVDWAAWLRWVERHRVGSFLHHRLPPAVRASLPESAAAGLRTQAVLNAQRALARTGELLRLTSQLERDGIRVMAFKGPVLSQQLFGETGLRPAGDLDLLVSPADVATASAVLQGQGYQRTFPDFELTALQWRKFLNLQHEVNHRHPERGVTVELQWRLEGMPDQDFEELWKARRSVSLAGQSLAVMPELLEQVFLFVHGARHGWQSLFWLLDVALLLQNLPPEQEAALVAAARRFGATKALAQGAVLAWELFGVAVPTDCERVGLSHSLVVTARRRLATEGRASSWRATMADTAYQLRLQDDWRGRFSLVQPRLLSPQNWKWYPLPDRWFWLYYPAAPLLWVWRQLRPPAGDHLTPSVVAENPPPVNPQTR